MNQKDFLEILRRYQSGCASEGEKQIVEKWYEEMEQHKEDIYNLDEAGLEEEYLTTIMRHVEKPRAHQQTSIQAWGLPRYFVGIAASLLLTIVSVYVITNRTPKRKDQVASNELPAMTWKQVANNSGAEQRYTLPDGSNVTLKPKSSIKFSTLFNELVREVQLEGEGFFEVTKNKDKPFLVYTNEVTTKVLGTSFRVRSFHKDKSVTVAVKTGKVSVYANPSETSDEMKEIILTPNQEVIYDRTEKIAARRIVETPEPIISVEEIARMRFEDAPLKEILEAIEKIYGVDIEYDEAQFASCTLTTSVSGGGLYNRMDIITSAIGAEYELDENKIIVKGTGCK